MENIVAGNVWLELAFGPKVQILNKRLEWYTESDTCIEIFV